jgi:hypothetical protein
MPESKININFSHEKHMKNGQKMGDFDVKRIIPEEKKLRGVSGRM